jgi:hypothetical protein
MESSKMLGDVESWDVPSDKKILTDKQKLFLSKDISWFDMRDLARYIVSLSQEITELRKLNQVSVDNLDRKISDLHIKFTSLQNTGIVSEKSIWLMEQLRISLLMLKQTQGAPAATIDYHPLQFELTESQIDDVVERLNEILNNDATIITVGVNKYTQSWESDLTGTLNDVTAVNKKIHDEYGSSRVSSLTDEWATKDTILQTIRAAPENKWLFFYFSWHGQSGHIVPYSQERFMENKIPRLDRMISPQELFAAIGDRKAIVIVDKCFGWDLTLLAPKNVTVVSASDSFTPAEEITVNESPWWVPKMLWKEEYKTEDGIQRGMSTYHMTDNWPWLNIDWFVRGWKTQNPTIKF